MKRVISMLGCLLLTFMLCFSAYAKDASNQELSSTLEPVLLVLVASQPEEELRYYTCCTSPHVVVNYYDEHHADAAGICTQIIYTKVTRCTSCNKMLSREVLYTEPGCGVDHTP